MLKVIIETALLTQDEKVMACELSKKAGADFVKTCTGFFGGGASVEDLSLMRRVVGREMGVKASGGVRTYKNALSFIGAGANRLGCVVQRGHRDRGRGHRELLTGGDAHEDDRPFDPVGGLHAPGRGAERRGERRGRTGSTST